MLFFLIQRDVDVLTGDSAKTEVTQICCKSLTVDYILKYRLGQGKKRLKKAKKIPIFEKLDEFSMNPHDVRVTCVPFLKAQ